MLKSLNIPIEVFIRPFFDTDETVCLRVFDDRKDSTFRGAKPGCKAGTLDHLEKELHKHNAMNRRIFFTVNFDGLEDEGISGTSTKNRDGFNRMTVDALIGKINLILTKSVSRFAINTVDTLTTVRKLKKSRGGVLCEREHPH